MPKVIEKVREQLLEEVRRQITERGYSQTTIRSVASACNLGVGTVYNYFQSKDMLIATVVVEDWKLCMQRFMKEQPDGKTTSAKETLNLIYTMLQTFEEEHKTLFTDPEAVKKFSSGFNERHAILRNQIAQFILPTCLESCQEGCKENQDPQFLSQFIAEALLTWFVAKVPFENLYAILKKLI